MRGLISSWVSEFGHESGFAAVRQLKDSLSAQGLQFPSSVARGGASSAPQSSSQREMDDLKRAIELSLQEQPKTTPPSSSLYPSVGGVASQQNTWSTPKPNVSEKKMLKWTSIALSIPPSLPHPPSPRSSLPPSLVLPPPVHPSLLLLPLSVPPSLVPLSALCDSLLSLRPSLCPL